MSLAYRVKKKYQFGIESYMRGNLLFINNRPETMQVEMENEQGMRILVDDRYRQECMEPVFPELEFGSVDDEKFCRKIY